MTLAGDLSVHSIRRQIDLAWPRDRAVINENLLEKLHISQRRECTRQIFPPQAHTSLQSVFELDKETVVRLRFHFNYVPIHRTILRSRQRLNLRRGSILAAEPPAFKQFLSMYHRPFLDQVQSPAGSWPWMTARVPMSIVASNSP